MWKNPNKIPIKRIINVKVTIIDLGIEVCVGTAHTKSTEDPGREWSSDDDYHNLIFFEKKLPYHKKH